MRWIVFFGATRAAGPYFWLWLVLLVFAVLGWKEIFH